MIDFTKTRLDFVVFDKVKTEINLPQVCLVGRSNVGKSSLINLLTMQPKLAKVSKLPGRTRSINFFNVEDKLYLVDLPGYGYAEVSLSVKENFSKVIDDYFASQTISLVLLLIDSRRGLLPIDLDMLDYMQEKNINYHLIFTKADKLSKNDKANLLNSVKKKYDENIKDNSLFFSKLSKEGLEELKKMIENKIF